jgi:hypothetical protein
MWSFLKTYISTLDVQTTVTGADDDCDDCDDCFVGCMKWYRPSSTCRNKFDNP